MSVTSDLIDKHRLYLQPETQESSTEQRTKGSSSTLIRAWICHFLGLNQAQEPLKCLLQAVEENMEQFQKVNTTFHKSASEKAFPNQVEKLTGILSSWGAKKCVLRQK